MSHKKAKKERKAKRQYSTLEEHTRAGGTLIPPLAKANMTPRSWVNDRLPDMLWAALLVTADRDAALEVFRELAKYGAGAAHDGQGELDSVTHSAIAAASAQTRQELIGIITNGMADKVTLCPLLLFDALPSRDAWIRALGTPVGPIDWGPLMTTIARTLDHQSQEATDCRWAKIIFRLASGHLHLPADGVREIADYPNFGDQRRVRPTIRAMEISFGSMGEETANWPAQFWAECLRATSCQAPSQELEPVSVSRIGTESSRVEEVYGRLIAHSNASRSTTAVDARHDTVFGTALYCLSLIRELLVPGAGNSIIARMALRTVLECYITLAYLFKRDELNLWQSYRVYGAGQAKLSYLKVSENDEFPSYISPRTLEALTNEDQWQEYLRIDLGHWDKSNLRQMSETAGVKADYDNFYLWPSAYAHGHWGAVRDSVLTVCINPLHRLHRIARPRPRMLNDVIPDVCVIFDKILGLVDREYPTFSKTLSCPAEPSR